MKETSKEKHTTVLLNHFQGKHIWLDIILLSIIWLMAWLIPQSYLLFNFLPFATILKIIGLVGMLDLLCFFSFHLVGHKTGLLLQGLLGGFISSTAIYVQLTTNKKFSNIDDLLLSKALIMATIAMLSECVLIIYMLAPMHASYLISPVIIQLLILSVSLFFLKSNSEDKLFVGNLDLEFDHPILWKNVLSLSLTILLLILAMRIMSNNFQLPYSLTTFLLSLFESHGVLAATMIETANNPDKNFGLHLVFIILLGNITSKSFFIIRTKNKRLYTNVLPPLIGSYLFPLFIFFEFFY